MNLLTPSQIRDELIGYWKSNYSTTPTEYQNIKFNGDKTQPFVQFAIGFSSSRTVIKGDGTGTRHVGIIRILVRVPVLSGSKTAYEITDVVCNTLERKRISSISTRASEIDDLGEVDDEYYIIAVTVPFVVT